MWIFGYIVNGDDGVNHYDGNDHDAMTKHDLDCTGCKKGLILGTRRLKSEVTHTSLVKRTLLVMMIKGRK